MKYYYIMIAVLLLIIITCNNVAQIVSSDEEIHKGVETLEPTYNKGEDDYPSTAYNQWEFYPANISISDDFTYYKDVVDRMSVEGFSSGLYDLYSLYTSTGWYVELGNSTWMINPDGYHGPDEQQNNDDGGGDDDSSVPPPPCIGPGCRKVFPVPTEVSILSNSISDDISNIYDLSIARNDNGAPLGVHYIKLYLTDQKRYEITYVNFTYRINKSEYINTLENNFIEVHIAVKLYNDIDTNYKYNVTLITKAIYKDYVYSYKAVSKIIRSNNTWIHIKNRLFINKYIIAQENKYLVIQMVIKPISNNILNSGLEIGLDFLDISKTILYKITPRIKIPPDAWIINVLKEKANEDSSITAYQELYEQVKDGTTIELGKLYLLISAKPIIVNETRYNNAPTVLFPISVSMGLRMENIKYDYVNETINYDNEKLSIWSPYILIGRSNSTIRTAYFNGADFHYKLRLELFSVKNTMIQGYPYGKSKLVIWGTGSLLSSQTSYYKMYKGIHVNASLAHFVNISTTEIEITPTEANHIAMSFSTISLVTGYGSLIFHEIPVVGWILTGISLASGTISYIFSYYPQNKVIIKTGKSEYDRLQSDNSYPAQAVYEIEPPYMLNSYKDPYGNNLYRATFAYFEGYHVLINSSNMDGFTIFPEYYVVDFDGFTWTTSVVMYWEDYDTLPQNNLIDIGRYLMSIKYYSKLALLADRDEDYKTIVDAYEALVYGITSSIYIGILK